MKQSVMKQYRETVQERAKEAGRMNDTLFVSAK